MQSDRGVPAHGPRWRRKVCITRFCQQGWWGGCRHGPWFVSGREWDQASKPCITKARWQRNG
eukprot:7024124-Pyramimonas_sp.AAC.1